MYSCVTPGVNAPKDAGASESESVAGTVPPTVPGANSAAAGALPSGWPPGPPANVSHRAFGGCWFTPGFV